MQIELTVFYARLGSIALIMALGFLLGKLKLISEHTNKQITNLLLTVFMPASLFMAFPSEYDQGSANLFFSGLLAGAIIMLVLIIIAKILFNKGWMKRELSNEAQFAMIFNNATFLGYPIVANTFGPTGILAYCGFIISFNIALFSYGIWLFEQKVSVKLLFNIIFNPNKEAVSYVGGATTPLSIICIGFMLSQAKLSKVFAKWKLMLTAIIQLTLGPLVTWGLLTLFQFPVEVIQVCTLIQTLPTATSLGLFAVKYGGNAEESSELVTISTLFSVVTMPLMTFLLLIVL